MKARNYERVEKLFQRSLIKILNIDLWKLYLTYVKETKAGLSTHKWVMNNIHLKSWYLLKFRYFTQTEKS